jgi:hypothetical protein
MRLAGTFAKDGKRILQPLDLPGIATFWSANKFQADMLLEKFMKDPVLRQARYALMAYCDSMLLSLHYKDSPYNALTAPPYLIVPWPLSKPSMMQTTNTSGTSAKSQKDLQVLFEGMNCSASCKDLESKASWAFTANPDNRLPRPVVLRAPSLVDFVQCKGAMGELSLYKRHKGQPDWFLSVEGKADERQSRERSLELTKEHNARDLILEGMDWKSQCTLIMLGLTRSFMNLSPESNDALMSDQARQDELAELIAQRREADKLIEEFIDDAKVNLPVSLL